MANADVKPGADADGLHTTDAGARNGRGEEGCGVLWRFAGGVCGLFVFGCVL